RRCAFTASAAARSFARWTSTPTCCAAWTPGVTAKSSRPGGAPAARPRRSRPSTPTRRFRSDAPPTSQRWAAVREPHHAGAGDRPGALADRARGAGVRPREGPREQRMLPCRGAPSRSGSGGARRARLSRPHPARSAPTRVHRLRGRQPGGEPLHREVPGRGLAPVMTYGSLFSGIGGMDLGLERAGWECRWQVECDPFCLSVLERHWPDVPRFRDVRAVGSELERVDLIAGGFPCQDVSVAGARAGIGGERSGLWSEFARIVSCLRPRWVLVENVPGLRTQGADRVLHDLEARGYTAWASVVGARHVGAPHRRDRVWIVGLADAASDGRGRGMADACCVDLVDEPRRRDGSSRPGAPVAGASDRERWVWPSGPREPQHDWEEPRVVYAQRQVRGGFADAQVGGAVGRASPDGTGAGIGSGNGRAS